MLQNRSTCTVGTRPCHPDNLAQTVACVTRHGLHAFGELPSLVGKRSDALARMSDGISEDMTLRIAKAVTAVQRDTRIVEQFARACGGVFVALDARATTDSDVQAALLEAVRELGEDSGLIARALADGRITQAEADDICREVDETVAALLEVKARVRAKVVVSVPARPSMVRPA